MSSQRRMYCLPSNQGTGTTETCLCSHCLGTKPGRLAAYDGANSTSLHDIDPEGRFVDCSENDQMRCIHCGYSRAPEPVPAESPHDLLAVELAAMIRYGAPAVQEAVIANLVQRHPAITAMLIVQMSHDRLLSETDCNVISNRLMDHFLEQRDSGRQPRPTPPPVPGDWQLYTATYTHKFGEEFHLVWLPAGHVTPDAHVVAALGLDFEPEEGEELELSPVEIAEIPVVLG